MLKEIVKSKSLSWDKNNVSEDNFSFSLSKSILSEIGNNRQELKKWDIGFLEQVAKKKLKSKVDNIDKAGLRDVLDG